MVIYMFGPGFDLGTTENKSSKWPHGERDSNLRPPDSASEALTTRPRYLLLLHCTYGGPAKVSRTFQYPHGNLNFHTAILKFKSTYHLHLTEIFHRNFRGTGIFFFGTENRNGIELYHLQNTGKVFGFSGHEAWH